MLITGCVEPPEVCCVDLYAIASHILTASYDALLPCFDGLECDPLAAYVTIGAGDDGVADALTVEIDTTAPSAGSTVGGRTLPLPLMRAGFTVRLRESGWPTARIDGGKVVAPPPADQNEAARQFVAHGEKLYRNLLNMHSRRQLIPESVPGCGAPLIGALTPMPPRGGVVGWFVSIVVDVPFGGG